MSEVVFEPPSESGKFAQCLAVVARRSKPILVGDLTFGEIANNGRDSLDFLNKISVVGRIGNG